MGSIITIRLNEDEEKVLNKLLEHFHTDQKSTILKKALYDLYEDIEDMKAIEEFEEREKKGEVKWHSFEEIIKSK